MTPRGLPDRNTDSELSPFWQTPRVIVSFTVIDATGTAFADLSRHIVRLFL